MNDYYALDEVCNVKGGKRIPKGQSLQTEQNNHPYIRVENMYQGRILEMDSEVLYAKDDYWPLIKTYTVKSNDIIMAIVGTIGMISIIGDSLNGANLTENCCKFVDIDINKVSPLFLYYALKAPFNQDQIKKFTVGSMQPKLPIYNIKQLRIPAINKKQQKQIVDILSSLDKKIEINNAINSELESIAKTIYDYWFLQFEFPNEEGKPYKSSGGEMVWNDELKQEIPEGWEVHSIEDFGNLGNGINYEKGVKGDKEYKIINIRNMSSCTLLLSKDDMDDICLPSKTADRYLINKDDILIARSGIPGSVRIMDNNDNENTVFCGFIIRLSLTNSFYRDYLVYKLKDYENTNATTSGGTILQNVSQDTLKLIKFAVPYDSVLSEFNQIIDSLWKTIYEKDKESQQLASLRDFLLPLLMNGQVGFKKDGDE